MSDHIERLARDVKKAWVTLPHDAKMRLWNDPEANQLYWSVAHLSAAIEARNIVNEITDGKGSRWAGQ